MNRQLFTLIAVVIAMPYVLMQVRKPTRWVGRFFLWSMNRSHSGLTEYYWPNLAADLKEVLRVVKPGGVGIVIAEAYSGGGWVDLVQRPAMALLRAKYLSVDEHREWFTSAGFADVQVYEEKSHGWICITGRAT